MCSLLHEPFSTVASLDTTRTRNTNISMACCDSRKRVRRINVTWVIFTPCACRTMFRTLNDTLATCIPVVNVKIESRTCSCNPFLFRRPVVIYCKQHTWCPNHLYSWGTAGIRTLPRRGRTGRRLGWPHRLRQLPERCPYKRRLLNFHEHHVLPSSSLRILFSIRLDNSLWPEPLAS